MKVIKNSKIILDNDIIEDKAVLFDDKIIDIVDCNGLDCLEAEEIIDGKGMYLSPGFIDIHVHGCSKMDVMDMDNDNLKMISSKLPSTGVTSFLPTTMTMKLSHIEAILSKIKTNMGYNLGAEILGCHLEGPFISPKYKGAQDETYIIKPEYNLVENYKDIIKIVTMAPEIEGSLDFIKYLSSNNIVVSLGHTNATYEEAAHAINAGASHITHTFNAMTPLNHRHPGVVCAAMLGDVTCELIADNIHVHPEVQNLLVKVKGTDKVVLITDAMRACLMGDGSYDLGGQDVIVSNGQARLSDGTLAGSVLTLNTALKHIIQNTGLSIVDAIKMVTANPARITNTIHRKGFIKAGYDADMVLFDEEFNVYLTLAGGNTAYKK